MLAMGAFASSAFASPRAFASSAASTSGATPLAGDWEGSGPHGLPLSFSLQRHHGQLVATSIVLGAPLTCPAIERDAEAVPLSGVAYAGPGAGASTVSGAQAVLSGQVPGLAETAELKGAFVTPRAGSFSIEVSNKVGCGWPSQTLKWQVYRAPRLHVSDGTWTASLSGPGITAGGVTIEVAGGGRVLQTFHTSFNCRSSTKRGHGRFTTTPAYEFIRPDGSFYSPLTGNPDHGRNTTWAGWFTAAGDLSGTIQIYDACTGGLVRAQFQR
jgi:hypothetical protein